MYKYAGIIVNNDAIKLDRIFTYSIPEALQQKAHIGFRVKVPFGMGNRKVDGFIVELYENSENLNKIKEISEICDDFQVLTENDILLVNKMKERYLCTYLECIKTIIPTGITKGIKNKTSEVISILKPLEGKYNKEPYITIQNIVKNNNGVFNRNELSKKYNISLSSLNTLLKYGFLCQDKVIVNRYNSRQYDEYSKKELNEEQKDVVDKILSSNKNLYLIHGITGSGKTEIYMNLVSSFLEQGKESIILVPEIALTPQMVERFKGRFGNDITVFHSKLSDGERYDEWLRVKEGKVKVAVGARSAIFLPFKNLRLIVIDEEHEGSYKSESDPKYNAREIGEMKCEIEKCKLVLGSATPSVDTYFRALKGDIELLTLKYRADGAMLPTTEVVDMREELANNNKSIFSKKLYFSIKESLEKREQVILFLNRRGFSTFVSCRKCGYVFKCDSCDISLTYHNEAGVLTCHYCGKSRKLSNLCPKCGSKYVKYFGVGTEKVEQEIKRYFPKARTIRMDFDTTRKKDSYENIYNTFKENKADILIGTQMVAKGLDFKDVTLVGVLAADLSLNLPDYRASERTFQLVTQVSGRAGRGKKPGKVIIQTYNPESYSIEYASSGNYVEFYKEEILLRENMNYPPFSEILSINLSSKNESLLIKNIQNVGINLNHKLANNDKINMLGPCPCIISKIKEQYRWQIILKGKIDSSFAKELMDLVYEELKEVYTDIRISIDLNPNSLL